MSAPVIIGEPCGCMVLEAPDLTATQYLGLTEHERAPLNAWMDANVEAWRQGRVTAISHGDGVLSVQHQVRNTVTGDLALHDIGTPDAHIAATVLTLNTERPPIPE